MLRVCYMSPLISSSNVFFLMIRRPPRSTRTDTLFPYTTRFRSFLTRWLLLTAVLFGGSAARRAGSPARRPPSASLGACRSEEHTSELQSLMRISYAVFCLKKKTQIHITADETN